MIEGTAAHDEYRGDGALQIRVKRLLPFDLARQQFLKSIALTLNEERLNGSIDVLYSILAEYRVTPAPAEPENLQKPCEVLIHYERNDVRGDIMLGTNWRVTPNDDLLLKLRQQYGAAYIHLNY